MDDMRVTPMANRTSQVKNKNLSDCLQQMSSNVQQWPSWKKRIFGEAFPKPSNTKQN